MPVRVQCPNPDCQASFSVAPDEAARFRRCPQCGWDLSAVGGDPNAPRPDTSATPLGSAPSWLARSVLAENTLFALRYKILRPLGRGGMGAVYLAHDSQLDRDVALKIPHVFSADDEPESVKRFYREAQSAARLNHPNICPVYDVATYEGQPYLTMAFIEGLTLSDRLKQRTTPFEPVEAVLLVRKLALALHYAHEAGVIHRDLKPANIMIDGMETPVVMDFGLARRSAPEVSLLTGAGHQIGTPAYMSLEQHQGDVKAMGPRSDVYSLGVILFELLTGRRPYGGNTATAVLVMMLREGPPAPSAIKLGLDAGLDEICLKAMAREAGDRYATMAAFAQALEGLLSRTSSNSIEETRTVVKRGSAIDEPSASSVSTKSARNYSWDSRHRK